MNEFITLRREDPEFKEYLSGEIKDGRMAVPVETADFATTREVTFRLLKKSERPKISKIEVWMKAARIELLCLSMMPAVAIWIQARPEFESGMLGLLALLSLFFLHCGVMALNDVNDHISGVDRVNEKGGSRVLQNGWISMKSLKRMAYFNLGIGVALALPVVYLRPELTLLVAVAAVLAFVCGTHARWGYNKIWLSTEAAAFLILGPLLALGMQWVLQRDFSAQAMCAGTGFGLIAVSYLGSRQMISQMVDHLAGIKTLPVILGFDRARLVVSLMFVVGTVVMVPLFGWVMLASVFLALLLAYRLLTIQSPLSSKLTDMPTLLLLLHMVAGICAVIAAEIRI